jgi:hypothetical protein
MVNINKVVNYIDFLIINSNNLKLLFKILYFIKTKLAFNYNKDKFIKVKLKSVNWKRSVIITIIKDFIKIIKMDLEN